MCKKMNKSKIWNVDDKDWYAHRLSEWEKVKFNLEILCNYRGSNKFSPRFKKSYISKHKKLFLSGDETVCDPAEDLDVFAKPKPLPFLNMIQFFQLWYHPQPELLDINEIRKKLIKAGSFEIARENFFTHFFATGCNPNHIFDPVYGFMAGRENLFIELFVPEFDFQIRLGSTENNNGWAAALTPYETYIECYYHSILELRKDFLYVPNAPGQYLWDHLSFAMDKYHDRIFESTPTAHDNKVTEGDMVKDNLRVLIAEILSFENRQDLSNQRISTQKFAHNMIQKYESKSFSEPMLQLWDDSKNNLEKYKALAVEDEIFSWNLEFINETYKSQITKEQADERIAKWTL